MTRLRRTSPGRARDRPKRVSRVSISELSRKAVVALAVFTAVGLAGYAVSYLVVLPDVGSAGFMPTSLGELDGTPSAFATVLAGFALLYAFAFLPVAAMVTVRRYQTAPVASVFAVCLAGVSSIIEIVNNLPVLAARMYGGELAAISDDVLLRLIQVDAIRYLALDVAGFTLAYLAFVFYALAAWRTTRWPAYATGVSIGLFVINVPCLWFSPKAAVVLMAISILILSVVELGLGRIAAEDSTRAGRSAPVTVQPG